MKFIDFHKIKHRFLYILFKLLKYICFYAIAYTAIWLIYFRAYTQNYARYLKKKMTQAEFQKWADFALELRQKAVDGELDLEEYRRIMRE